ncbi:O-methyltransferase [Isoptericola sp. NPDC058082]|uniref:O-methyltransferase n=1 Tax=Isoptericola sp. NPDC058082 TaxID=3346331 RepID=UPI0036ED0EE1
MLEHTASAPARAHEALVRAARSSWSTAQDVRRLATRILEDPQQSRYLRRWLSTYRRSTLDLELPWLPFQVIDRLDAVLDRSSRVFEFGGGGSTVWLARRVGEVVTAEHDPEWHALLTERTRQFAGVTVLDLDMSPGLDDYVASIDAFPDGFFDLVVVDGRERVRCFHHALPKVRPGGVLILDDSQRDRYARAFGIAGEHRHVTIRGLAPCKTTRAHTTVWTVRDA